MESVCGAGNVQPPVPQFYFGVCTMHVGNVSTVKLDRGFGFILSVGGRSIFFHYRELSPHLPFDQRLLHRTVQFEIEDTPKGPKAVKIHPAD